MAHVLRKHSSTSNIHRVMIRSSTTGQGVTGLTISSTGLIISTIADVEATATSYTAAGSTIETITTLGTFAAPTATKCRFKEVDATNHPGVYEIQLADARYAVASAKVLRINVVGVSGMLQSNQVIQLTSFDPDDVVRAGLTSLPNAAVQASGGLYTRGTGSGQINQETNGRIDVNAVAFGGTAGTFASGRPEVNASHVAGSAVSTSTAQIGVNVVNAAGTAWNSGAIGAATLASDTITAAKVAADAIGASELAADAAAEIATAVRSELTTELGRVDAAVTSRLAPTVALRTLDVSAGGEAGVDWANVGSPTTTVSLSGTTVGTATNLTNAATSGDLTATMKASVNTEADTALSDVGMTTTITGRIDRAISAIVTTAMTESYAADGATMTVAQALYLIQQRLNEFAISGTTVTIKKLDGSTTAATLTLDSSTSPTSTTRAS